MQPVKYEYVGLPANCLQYSVYLYSIQAHEEQKQSMNQTFYKLSKKKDTSRTAQMTAKEIALYQYIIKQHDKQQNDMAVNKGLP